MAFLSSWILKSVSARWIWTALRPRQLAVLAPTAGQDATEAFFSLHRAEVLEKPQYKRLQIGTIEGEESVIFGRQDGQLSKVPYAEPTWLSDGYFSPYFTEVSVTRREYALTLTRHS